MSSQEKPAEKPVKATLYVVKGTIEKPEKQKGILVQFNPSSLKVSLSNSLGENERSGNTRAAQYIDKSSSNLTVELIFDTTDVEASKDGPKNAIDVRSRTGEIAKTFMDPGEPQGDEKPAPKRCLFQWGSFSFIGIMESFDETLDYFSSEGTPLRSTVSLKLSESRFQFLSSDANAAKKDTPKLSSPPEQGSVNDANKEAGKKEKEWRDTSMYNGVESPRLPSSPALAVPTMSASASIGISASVGAKLTPPSFKYGASASLGTNITGAFSSNMQSGGGLSAGALVSGGASLRGEAKAGVSGSAKAGTGFD